MVFTSLALALTSAPALRALAMLTWAASVDLDQMRGKFTATDQAAE